MTRAKHALILTAIDPRPESQPAFLLTRVAVLRLDSCPAGRMARRSISRILCQ